MLFMWPWTLIDKLQKLQWTPYVVYNIIYFVQFTCNSHATSCNNLHIKFSHTFQHGFSSICQRMMYVNTFYNLFTTSLTNIIFNYFVHPFDKWILNILSLQFIYNYFIISLMNIFFNYSFIHLNNEFYSYPLLLSYK
jgi:hypothetical protein